MKARRRSIKWILLAVLSAAACVAYAHFGLLPGDLRGTALRKIEQLTGRRVAFDKALWIPFRGLTFRNIRIGDPKTGRVIFAARHMALNVRLIPFLTDKKIVVANVYLDSPVADLALEPEREPLPPPPLTKISGQIPVPVAGQEPRSFDPRRLEDGPNAFVPENVYLEQIEVVDGTFLVRKRAGEPVSEELRTVNLRMRFTRPPLLDIEGSLRVGRTGYAVVALKGIWDLDRASYDFRLRTKCDGVPAWLERYQKKSFLTLRGGTFSLDTRLKSVEERKVVFRTEADLKDTVLSANNATYSGHMALEATGAFDFRTLSFPAFKGNLDFVDVRIENLSEKVKLVEEISGRILFEPDLLDLSALRGKYRDVVFEASGTVRSFKEPVLEAEILTHAGIAKVLALLPERDRRALEAFRVEGRCEAVMAVSGPLRPARLKTEHKLVLGNGSVRDREGKVDISGISGEVASSDEGVRIDAARFTLARQTYSLHAFIPKTPDAPGKLNLAGRDLSVAAEYTLEGNSANVTSGQAAWRGVTASFSGRIDDLRDPLLDLRGRASADLARVTAAFADRAPALRDEALSGTLKGNFTLQGPARSPVDWHLDFDATGPAVLVRKGKVRLDEFEAQVRLKNRTLNIPFLQAKPYGGIVGLKCFYDLRKPEAFFNGKIYANNVDLKRLGRDLELEDKDLAGTLILQSTLQGTAGRPETYAGQGTIDIRKGHIWKTDLFKKMGELPFVKVIGLDEVVFRDGHADFDIRDRRFWTKNLNLYSETVDLTFDGSVGFDQTLDLVMDIRYSAGIFEGAVETGGIVPFVVQQASGLISQYKISGTLKKPKNEKILLPPVRSVGKKLGDIVQGVVR